MPSHPRWPARLCRSFLGLLTSRTLSTKPERSKSFIASARGEACSLCHDGNPSAFRRDTPVAEIERASASNCPFCKVIFQGLELYGIKSHEKIHWTIRERWLDVTIVRDLYVNEYIEFSRLPGMLSTLSCYGIVVECSYRNEKGWGIVLCIDQALDIVSFIPYPATPFKYLSDLVCLDFRPANTVP